MAVGSRRQAAGGRTQGKPTLASSASPTASETTVTFAVLAASGEGSRAGLSEFAALEPKTRPIWASDRDATMRAAATPPNCTALR